MLDVKLVAVASPASDCSAIACADFHYDRWRPDHFPAPFLEGYLSLAVHRHSGHMCCPEYSPCSVTEMGATHLQVGNACVAPAHPVAARFSQAVRYARVAMPDDTM